VSEEEAEAHGSPGRRFKETGVVWNDILSVFSLPLNSILLPGLHFKGVLSSFLLFSISLKTPGVRRTEKDGGKKDSKVYDTGSLHQEPNPIQTNFNLVIMRGIGRQYMIQKFTRPYPAAAMFAPPPAPNLILCVIRSSSLSPPARREPSGESGIERPTCGSWNKKQPRYKAKKRRPHCRDYHNCLKGGSDLLKVLGMRHGFGELTLEKKIGLSDY
jgi:hypothetical protein